VGEITLASEEQRQGIGAINNAVAEVDGMTQQNSALVEQGAAAAESLREQATLLASAVAAFKLGEGALPAGAAEPVPPRAVEQLAA